MDHPEPNDCYVESCGQRGAAWAKSSGWFKGLNGLRIVIPLCEEHADLLERHMEVVWREPQQKNPLA